MRLRIIDKERRQRGRDQQHLRQQLQRLEMCRITILKNRDIISDVQCVHKYRYRKITAFWLPHRIRLTVPCWEPAPDIWRRHSTLDVVCALLTQPCWWYRPPDVQHSVTVLTSGFGTCVEQPAVVCQERTVADDVPSRAEDCTFPVVVWQWLGDRDCTAQYNYCLPATTDCRRFCCFVCFSFLFNSVRCPCNVFDVIVSP